MTVLNNNSRDTWPKHRCWESHIRHFVWNNLGSGAGTRLGHIALPEHGPEHVAPSIGLHASQCVKLRCEPTTRS